MRDLRLYPLHIGAGVPVNQLHPPHNPTAIAYARDQPLCSSIPAGDHGFIIATINVIFVGRKCENVDKVHSFKIRNYSDRCYFWGALLISRVSATEFMRPMINGKTGPALINCQRANGEDVEVVTKCSAGCEQKETSLAAEVIGACLAADLGLPILEPFLVELDPEFIASVPNAVHRDRMTASNFVAFGSKHITGQYSAWTNGNLISEAMLPSAAAVFVFDGIIQNSDRREGNPNCLVRGDEIRI